MTAPNASSSSTPYISDRQAAPPRWWKERTTQRLGYSACRTLPVPKSLASLAPQGSLPRQSRLRDQPSSLPFSVRILPCPSNVQAVIGSCRTSFTKTLYGNLLDYARAGLLRNPQLDNPRRYRKQIGTLAAPRHRCDCAFGCGVQRPHLTALKSVIMFL